MVGLGKAGALVLVFVAPFWLQGCDPESIAVLATVFYPLTCVPNAEVAYLNSTVTQGEYYDCVQGLNGKVANASTCCVAKYYLEAVPPADALCCAKEPYEKLLENVTNDTLKSQAEKFAISYCHNITENLTIAYKELEQAACAPMVESTTKALDKEALYVLYQSELGKVKEVAAEREKEARNSMEIVSSRPAGAAAVFLFAGAVSALLAYGLMAFVKRARAQRERESAYNQLLA